MGDNISPYYIPHVEPFHHVALQGIVHRFPNDTNSQKDQSPGPFVNVSGRTEFLN